jgi:hypothetical protein
LRGKGSSGILKQKPRFLFEIGDTELKGEAHG